jgi:hypothetical protein
MPEENLFLAAGPTLVRSSSLGTEACMPNTMPFGGHPFRWMVGWLRLPLSRLEAIGHIVCPVKNVRPCWRGRVFFGCTLQPPMVGM